MMGTKAIRSFAVNSDVVKQEIEVIEGKYGIIKPRWIVDSARNEKSPLHNIFEWDDSVAGENFRMLQAGQLIASVKIKMEDRIINAFQSVSITIDDKVQKGYVSSSVVLNSPELKSQILESAIKEISYWQGRYKDVVELTGVVNEKKINKIKEIIKKEK